MTSQVLCIVHFNLKEHSRNRKARAKDFLLKLGLLIVLLFVLNLFPLAIAGKRILTTAVSQDFATNIEYLLPVVTFANTK